MDSAKLYTLQNVPGKGLGLVATANIAKGTRILSEAPLLRVSRSVAQVHEALSKIAALSDDKRQAFFSLHNSFEDEATREHGILRTNVLPLGSGASTGGIFVEASRINHSCLQNAQNTWNEGLQQLTIHAIRDIDEGEEITIMYLADRTNRATRQRHLQRNFRFTCSCQLCSLPPSRLGASDARLDEIQRLDESISDGLRITTFPLQALHDVHKLLRLCKEEGIDDGSVPRAYYDAFQIAVANSDRARARVFAERAAETRVIIEGDDSPEIRRRRDLARDPTLHCSYGCTSRWATSINGIPSGLSAEDFETWLWREQKGITPKQQKTTQERKKPTQERKITTQEQKKTTQEQKKTTQEQKKTTQEQKKTTQEQKKTTQEQPQYADLRNDVAFPSFGALPEEFGLELDSFEAIAGSSSRPRKHWCFLAEIVEIEDFLRLRLIVKDKAGRKSSVAFYTSGRGFELGPSCLREGFTVAILYAEQHGFIYMTVGIRHEEPRLLKIFPVSLDNLLSVSDKVQQYATLVNGERTCQGCSRARQATTSKKCAKCTLFWYCDKACQTIAWNEKGHKADCKLLSDPDLRVLLLLERDGFEQHHAFSVG